MKSILATTAVFSLTALQGLASSVAKSGCNAPLPADAKPGNSVDLTLPSSSGVSPRNYRLHLPAGYDGTKKLPLILSFHGRKRSAKEQEELSRFNKAYGFEGISVYPQGVTAVKTPQWEGDPDAPAHISDVKFTLELMDHLEETYCIDSSRIYATGKSNGGGFTGLLACDPTASKRIAAFAPVSGAFYLNTVTQQLPDCKPGRLPIPIMEFHGLMDSTINYTGGLNDRGNAKSADIMTYVDLWAKRDGFAIDAKMTSTLCDGSQAHKQVKKYDWGCGTVVHYAYKNLEHDWPSSTPNGDTQDKLTCKEAEATSLILAWFKKWTLEGRARV
ncbi:poly depolymerase [Ampelomyces quisqualis]|uniref:feruloyl esterase n=1 Tax=Ampelomyces quisqualis TaxID=50730 RepID=A0A6A5QN16_AMPQU|nr:poly depolymerase [Ampelomyces quisqualis]